MTDSVGNLESYSTLLTNSWSVSEPWSSWNTRVSRACRAHRESKDSTHLIVSVFDKSDHSKGGSIVLRTTPLASEGLVVDCGRWNVSEALQGLPHQLHSPSYLTSPRPPVWKPPINVSLCCMSIAADE